MELFSGICTHALFSVDMGDGKSAGKSERGLVVLWGESCSGL